MKKLLLSVHVLAVVSLAAAQFVACPDEVNAQCPRPSSGEAVLLSHPDDCSKYCECVDEGKAYELTCPPDLLWDETLTTCNFEYNVSTLQLRHVSLLCAVSLRKSTMSRRR